MDPRPNKIVIVLAFIAMMGFIFGGCYTRSELDGKTEEAFQAGRSAGYEDGYSAGFEDCGKVREATEAVPEIY